MGWSWGALGKRPIFFPVLSLLLGVVLGPELGSGTFAFLLTALLCVVGAFLFAPRAGTTVLVLLGFAAVGSVTGTLGLAGEVPPAAREVCLEGEVDSAGEHGFVLSVSRRDGRPAQFRAALHGERPAAVTVGQRVLVRAKLKSLVDAANPGEVDRTRWALRRGQPVSGAYRDQQLVVLSRAPAWRAWIARQHASLEAAVRAAAPDSPDAAALLLTLAAGQRAGLGDELEDDFARSGLAHVLSVSGLHVAVLAFSAFGLLRWLLTRRMRTLLRRVEPRRIAAPLAVPLVWIYVVFTGLQAPAVRSAVMCTLLLAGHALRRRSDPLNAIALAALLMCVVDPASPFDLSVQLSFASVAALVFLAPVVRQAVPIAPPSPASESGWRLRLSRAREAAVQTFAASVAVTVTTAPLVLSAFQRVSLAGLVSNVVTLPLSGLLTVLAASGAAVHASAPALAFPVLWLGVQVARVFVAIASAFAHVPGASVPMPALTPWVVAAWCAGLAVWVLLRGRWRWLALVAPAALAVHLATASVPAAGVDVTFLAVGHGDAIVVSSRGRHALIDGGGVPNGNDTGRRFVVPFARQRAIGRFDLVALSHAHPDHALGLISTLEVIPAERLWLPAGVGDGPLVQELVAASGDAEVEEREAGDGALALGDATIEVLGPPRDRTLLEGENDRSLVLLVRHREVTFLLAGDLEEAGEQALDVGAVTVVKAPHHGSDTSSTEGFVGRTQPRHVVFCVGKNNRFGFPRRTVVERYQAAGAQCHRTDVDGAITFHSDGQDVTVEKFHAQNRRQARRAQRE